MYFFNKNHISRSRPRKKVPAQKIFLKLMGVEKHEEKNPSNSRKCIHVYIFRKYKKSYICRKMQEIIT